MAKNKNAVVRYKVIDDLLSDQNNYYTIDDITNKVNKALEIYGYPTVVRRSIEKDLVFLEETPFFAVLERFSYNGKRCIRYQDQSFSIFNKSMTSKEKSLLIQVLSSLGTFDGLPNFQWLERLQKCYNINDSQKIISFSTNKRLKNSNIIASLYECISNKQVLSLEYKSFLGVEIEVFHFHPYLLKEYNNRWFLIGFRETDKRICNLPIDRILRFSVNESQKYIKSDQNLLGRYDKLVGVTIYEDTEPVDILFWASPICIPYIETKPIHESQELVSHLKNGNLYKIKCYINYELERELCSFFSELEVIEPKALRSSIIEKISKMNKIYSTNENRVRN